MKTHHYQILILIIINNQRKQSPMKTHHYLITGTIAGNPYRAEIYPKERIILCSSGVLGGLLPNADTEKRACDIVKRALWEHGLIIIYARLPIFKDWLFVEVQTCFPKVQFTKVTGLPLFGCKPTAAYAPLSPTEQVAVNRLP